jgi:hypothetical protein
MSSTGLVTVKVPILDGDGVQVARKRKTCTGTRGRWM